MAPSRRKRVPDAPQDAAEEVAAGVASAEEPAPLVTFVEEGSAPKRGRKYASLPGVAGAGRVEVKAGVNRERKLRSSSGGGSEAKEEESEPASGEQDRALPSDAGEAVPSAGAPSLPAPSSPTRAAAADATGAGATRPVKRESKAKAGKRQRVSQLLPCTAAAATAAQRPAAEGGPSPDDADAAPSQEPNPAGEQQPPKQEDEPTGLPAGWHGAATPRGLSPPSATDAGVGTGGAEAPLTFSAGSSPAASAMPPLPDSIPTPIRYG